MDGRKSKLSDSLQFRLSIGMTSAILAMALVAGLFSYWWAFEEAIELQDEQLIRLSALVNHQRIVQPAANTTIEVSSADPESHFVVQWLDSTLEQGTVELTDLPADLPEGLQTRLVENTSWRLLVKTFPNGARIVVGQQTEVRDELARNSALNTLIPLIILIPLLLLWVGYLIRQVFAPLKKMALQLDQSTDNNLTSLPETDLAAEISPFVGAINHLLTRVRDSIAQQRQFVRDAAHELRSPLTAISLQAERLVELSSGQENIHHRLINLHRATERTRILIEQLLTMARAQDKHISVYSQLSVKALLRELLEDLLPLAAVKKIDVAVIGNDVQVYSQTIDLQILLKNLIENAIHYTPPQGNIEIVLSENNHCAEVLVRDSGPGIAIAEQIRVFDPFYRVLGNDQPGSGLGLSIVRTIANRLNLKVSLYNNDAAEQTGLCVQVTFPAQVLKP
ncbi:ATP-binding protein [Cellvibrio sp. OA-2007]|uniref:ATP-binding protein n=1 Tax=Cellvibrio sp. OA-2007 TaxID=529823 RepID=UPI000785C08A|nr:ATP-binding protein [Cellvibrio sp. OA-2007]